jgi:hypothetical protein
MPQGTIEVYGAELDRGGALTWHPPRANHDTGSVPRRHPDRLLDKR